MGSIMDTISKIKLDRLLYTHYQHPDLDAAHQFFTDFGFYVADRGENLIYYRGFGENPYFYVAEKSPDKYKHFIGGGWVTESQGDLESASRLPGASEIQDSTAPGGGKFVDIEDPNGINVRFIHGLRFRPMEEQEEEKPKPVIFNSWEDKPRKGDFQRFDTGPSKVHKLGHWGLVVDKSNFESTIAWYMDTLSLAPTDSLFDKGSGKNMMTFLHIDKGEQFVDHHSFFVQSPPNAVTGSHPHHSSFEINNMDSQLVGHYHLQQNKFDASGNIVEHYSDGDLVNSKTTVTRRVAAPDTMAVWGPNGTLAFLTGRIEDIKKGAAVPDVEHGAATA